MNFDKQEIKAPADRVKTDRRFCADENHHVLADGVLALLAKIESAETRLHDVAVLCATVEQERDQLKAENEALRKDAERYRWLRNKQTFIWLIQDWFPGEAMLTNVDADIDAAMAKGTSHG